MNVKSVYYGVVLNLGDYSNERIGLTANVEEGEPVDEVVERLKAKIIELGGYNADKLYSQQCKLRQELKDLQRKVEKARNEWNAVAEFLRTQGIKPDAPNMPNFTMLLPEVSEVKTEVVDAEVEHKIDEIDLPY